MAEQRIPNMRGIMMPPSASPFEVVEPASTVADARQGDVKYALPDNKGSVRTLVDADDMDELVRLLHEEAKVI